MKRLLIALALSFMAFILIRTEQASAQTMHTVKSGDTLWKISQQYGVSLTSLRDSNNKYDDMLYIGDQLIIPTTITSSERDLMARLVRAEATGEPYSGKVAVAVVVLNRVDHKDFPNTIHDVIYETYEGKYYAFSPVQNGEINKPYDAESMKAVNEAIALRGTGSGSIFFYNPKTATSTWITSREVTVVIGNHTFAK